MELVNKVTEMHKAAITASLRTAGTLLTKSWCLLQAMHLAVSLAACKLAHPNQDHYNC